MDQKLLFLEFEYIFIICIIVLVVIMYLFYVKYPTDRDLNGN
jgi:hypothetical protein